MLKMKDRKSSEVFGKFMVSLVSILLGLFISIFFVMWGKDLGFFKAAALLFSSIWKGSFGSSAQFAEALVFTTPLIFTGLAHAVAFKTGLFNIGVEGQFIIGMLIASIIGLIPGIPKPLHILLIALGGMIGGGIWAGIPGYLKAKLGTNEVVNTIMMNFIAMYLSNYFTMGVFHKEGSASTEAIQSSAQLTRFLGPQYRLNTAIFIALIFVVLVYILLWKTNIGYELRAVGSNPSAAEYGGISIKKNIILAMVISGAIAGLGGALHVAGVQHMSMQLFGFTNLGMDGIAVALVAGSNPFGVILSALLFGSLNLSSGTMMLNGIPKQISYIIQGMVILFIAGQYVFKLLGDKKKKKGAVVNG